MQDLPQLDFLQLGSETKIPVPTVSHLEKTYKPKRIEKEADGIMTKHERAYDAFCRWSSLPHEIRSPKTLQQFEKKWKIPIGYTRNFRDRDEYRQKQLTYFWEWVLDHFPNVVYATYRGALKGSSAQSKIFTELVAKHLDIEKPVEKIQPFFYAPEVRAYYGVGKFLGKAFSIGKQFKGK